MKLSDRVVIFQSTILTLVLDTQSKRENYAQRQDEKIMWNLLKFKNTAENSGIIHKPVLKIKRKPNEDVK